MRRAPRFPALLLAGGLALAAACGDDDDSDSAASEQNGTENTAAGAPSQSLAPLPAPKRTEVVGAFWDGKVVVMAGLLQDDTPTTQVDFYDPATDTWASGPALPTPLHHAGAGVLGGRLYVVGGYTGKAGAWEPVDEVHSLGPGETAWRQEPSLLGPRGALAVASLDDALVAIGGVGAGERTTEILDAGGTAWTAGPDLNVEREHLAATGAGGRAWAIAGRLHTLESNRDTTESWGPGEDEWREEPKLNHTRGGVGAAAPGDRPCVAGGEQPGEPSTIETIECFDGEQWEVVARLEVPRHGVAVVAAGNRLHVIGGGPRRALFVSDTHEAFDL